MEAEVMMVRRGVRLWVDGGNTRRWEWHTEGKTV